jgi:SAM-dependent methyltransferase
MNTFVSLLKDRKLRFIVVRLRYMFLKKRMRFFKGGSNSIGEKTVEHNLSAFDVNAGYGCGGRMGLLIYPIISFYSFYTIDKSKLKVLMVGCRTEDDIYWMRAYGFSQAIGFDLFSYSQNILIGDIHQTDFADGSFDVVVLGWMISYTKDPLTVVKECRRILKKDGLLGIGLEHNPKQVGTIVEAPRVNPANSTGDLKNILNEAMDHKVLFEYDHFNDASGDFSTVVVTRVG